MGDVGDMPERRMFAKTIVTSDAFLDMPASARCLYFTLCMFADDDGFVNNPRSIMRQCGACDDDMKILLAKNFVLLFETGVIVIKHWRIHNYIQKDRYHPTKYQEEMSLLTENKNGGYSLDTTCIQTVSNVDTEVRLGKVSLGKSNKKYISPNPSPKSSSDEVEIVPQVDVWFTQFWEKYPKKVDKAYAKKAFAKKCKSEDDLKEILDGVEKWISCWKDPQYIPYPSKFLNSERYKDNPASAEDENPMGFLPF